MTKAPDNLRNHVGFAIKRNKNGIQRQIALVERLEFALADMAARSPARAACPEQHKAENQVGEIAGAQQSQQGITHIQGHERSQPRHCGNYCGTCDELRPRNQPARGEARRAFLEAKDRFVRQIIAKESLSSVQQIGFARNHEPDAGPVKIPGELRQRLRGIGAGDHG
ncbi:MAG: hypothetical protein ACT4OG_04780 [Alphaproteobacteria bacterium]